MLKFKSKRGFALCLVLSVCVSLGQCSAFRRRERENIGALVQVYSSNDRACDNFDLHGILTVEAILYAIDEINSGNHLDLETTLGYDIHETCPDVYKSTQDLVLQARTIKQNTSFAAVLSSMQYENVDSLLLLLTRQLPFVGCGSFSRRRVNKYLDVASTKSTNIFHAVPSHETLIKAMVDLMARFDWSYAAAIYDNETVSSSAVDFLEEETTKQNGCIVKTFGVQTNTDNWQVSKVIEELRVNLSVSVVVLLTTRNISVRVIDEAAKLKAKGITWIMGKDSWDRNIDGEIAQRVVVLDPSASSLPGFKEHLENLKEKPIRNRWLREIVADGYAKFSTPTSPSFSQGLVCNDPLDARCKINRTALKRMADELVFIAEDATCMLDAVFAVAHALAAREKCSAPCSPRDPLYEQLREVNFKSLTGRRVSFASDGFLKEVEYRIFVYLTAGSFTPSMRLDQDGNEKRREIGTWKILDGTAQLKILAAYRDVSGMGSHEVEIPYCTGRCYYGQCKAYKKNTRRGAGCCWQCRDCLDAAAQLAAKNNQTTVCPGGACPKHVAIDYLHWNETGTLVLLFLIALCVCLGIYISCVLLHNRDTPVMHRAKNATVTLLPFILLIFLLPLPLLCKPSEASCETYRVLFLFSLGIPLAALIAKAQVIQEAFYDCDGNVKGNWTCCSPRTTVLLLVLVLHVIFIVVVRMSEPADVLILPTSESAPAFLECSVHSSVSFPIMVLYLLIGAGLVSIMSLRDVSVPGNDFEVKWVSLSMFLWYILAFLYVALMFSVQGKNKILALGFLDLLHALNLFACLYIPKWFVVAFRPESNRCDASPFNVYLKAQEKVSLRLSSQGNESPVLSKRGCRDVVINSNDSSAVKDTYV